MFYPTAGLERGPLFWRNWIRYTQLLQEPPASTWICAMNWRQHLIWFAINQKWLETRWSIDVWQRQTPEIHALSKWVIVLYCPSDDSLPIDGNVNERGKNIQPNRTNEYHSIPNLMNSNGDFNGKLVSSRRKIWLTNDIPQSSQWRVCVCCLFVTLEQLIPLARYRLYWLYWKCP